MIKLIEEFNENIIELGEYAPLTYTGTLIGKNINIIIFLFKFKLMGYLYLAMLI